MPPEIADETGPPITNLGRKQRRVLGVLVEKGYTTPEAYPLTLKATTSGCNQKSNRDPLVEYSEDEVAETLEQLRGLGLVAEVHTESGRTSRFRHYMRRKFTLTEPQLAILTELLLRGRQQLGELRTRASRMAPIETLEQLRDELTGLIQLGLVQSNGSLERRGCEVDHNLYHPREGGRMETAPLPPEEPVSRPVEREATFTSPQQSPPPSSPPVATSPIGSAAPSRELPAATQSGMEQLLRRLADLEKKSSEIQDENQTLRERLTSVEAELKRLSDLLDSLTR